MSKENQRALLAKKSTKCYNMFANCLSIILHPAIQLSLLAYAVYATQGARLCEAWYFFYVKHYIFSPLVYFIIALSSAAHELPREKLHKHRQFLTNPYFLLIQLA